MSVILLGRAFLAWERRIEVGALILLALLVWINRLSPSLKLHRHANHTCQLSLADSSYLIHRFVKGVKGMSFTNIRLIINLPQKANILHVIFSFPLLSSHSNADTELDMCYHDRGRLALGRYGQCRHP